MSGPVTESKSVGKNFLIVGVFAVAVVPSQPIVVKGPKVRRKPRVKHVFFIAQGIGVSRSSWPRLGFVRAATTRHLRRENAGMRIYHN